jgi:hypothetical protein
MDQSFKENLTKKIVADGKFDEEEVHKMLNLGNLTASKAVLALVIQTIKYYDETGKIPTLTQDEIRAAYAPINIKKFSKNLRPIINKLQSLQHKESICVSVEMDETTDKLKICLALSACDFKPVIDLPDGAAKELDEQYGFLKALADAYWKQFIINNGELFKAICDHCKNIDFSAIKIDPDNLTSMYFDKSNPFRVSVYPYYVDKNGKPYQYVNSNTSNTSNKK